MKFGIKPAKKNNDARGNQKPQQMNMAINIISLNTFSVTRALGAVAFLLLLANIVGQLSIYHAGQADVYELAAFFYFDNEDNVPSGFSTLLLLISTLLLFVITLLNRNQTGSKVSYWVVLTVGFLFMALDEELSFHEKLIRPVRMLFNDDHYGIFYYTWVIPAIVLVLLLGLFFLKFVIQLPAKTRFNVILAATLYIGGAIGVELFGGLYHELYGNLNLTYSMIVTVEESLEMAGIIVFIRALLVYIGDNYRDVRFRVEGEKG